MRNAWVLLVAASILGCKHEPGSQGGVNDLSVAASDLTGAAPPDLTGVAPPDLFGIPPGDMAKPPGDLAGSPTMSSKWVMGYYAGYETTDYPVASIYWDGLSHIAVAFYLPNSDGTLDTSLFQGGSDGPKLAKAIVDAAHAHGKKAIISIGGSDTRPGWVGAASAANRSKFVSNLVALLTDPGFDGIDFDWEPVDYSADAASIKALVEAVRAAAPSSILTMPVFPQNTNIPDDLSLYGQIHGSLDQLNLMSYGMAGAYPGWKSWHSSALYQSDSLAPTSIHESAAAYVAAGVPKAKLGVGSGFYGLCYSSPVTAPLQALNGATIKANDGKMSYRNIVTGYETLGNATKIYDAAAKVPYLTFTSESGAQGCRYVTYEDPQSIADKSAYVKAQGYGGTIIWTINQGYLPAAAVGARDPLLAAFKAGLLD